MAIENRDGTYWSMGETIDNDGIRFVSGDSRFYRVTARNAYDGAATLELYDAATVTGTPVASAKATAKDHVVDIWLKNGLYLDTGCILHTAGSSGETFQLVRLDVKAEGNAGAIS